MKIDKTKWEYLPLEDIATILNGYAFRSDNYSPNGIRIVRITNVQDGFIEDSDPKFYPISTEKEIQRYILHENDLLISLTGNVGRVGLLKNSFLPAALNQRVGCIRLKEHKNNIKFLYYQLRQNSFKEDCINYSKGVAQLNMSTEWLKAYKILIPSIAEQQAIASELDAIQTMIDGYKAQIADLDSLAQSIFLDMFGDPVSNPKGWEKKELRELGVISSGGTPLRSNPLYYKGDIDWYSAGELNHLYLNGSNEKITKEAIKESSAKLFKANSLFIGLYDTAAFKLGITLKEASANQACANLFPIKDNVIWIYYCLLNMKEYAWNFRKGIRQKNLSVGFIKSFSVPLPPLSLQQQFANQVETIEKQKDLLREQLKDAETLMAERMQYYFS